MTTVAVIHNHPIHYKHLLFTEMARRGLAFEVLFVSARSGIRIGAEDLRHELYRFSIGHEGDYLNHPKVSTCYFIWKRLSQLGPKAVIISGYYDIAGWTAWTWCQLNRVPAILWNESNAFDWARVWYKENLKRIYLKGVRYAHVYGKSNADYLVSLGLDRSRIIVKRAVADVQHFRPVDVSPKTDMEPLDLLYVGRLAEEKNILFVLQALALLDFDRLPRKLRFSIVGYGPLNDVLRSAIVELGLQKIAYLEGPLPQSALPERYSRADLFILPSIREPWGLVVLEAMLCGLPVMVSTRCGCAQDLVFDENGWRFSPFDVRTLADLLEGVSQLSRECLWSMGDCGRAIGKTYSPERCAEIVVDSVHKVLADAAIDIAH